MQIDASEVFERLTDSQLEFNLPRLAYKTKTRFLRQFGIVVQEFETPEVYCDDAGRFRTFREWFWRADALGYPVETYDSEDMAIEAAIEALRESYLPSELMEVLLTPGQSAHEILGGVQ